MSLSSPKSRATSRNSQLKRIDKFRRSQDPRFFHRSLVRRPFTSRITSSTLRSRFVTSSYQSMLFDLRYSDVSIFEDIFLIISMRCLRSSALRVSIGDGRPRRRMRIFLICWRIWGRELIFSCGLSIVPFTLCSFNRRFSQDDDDMAKLQCNNANSNEDRLWQVVASVSKASWGLRQAIKSSRIKNCSFGSWY